jgi:hypothetical protein
LAENSGSSLTIKTLHSILKCLKMFLSVSSKLCGKALE